MDKAQVNAIFASYRWGHITWEQVKQKLGDRAEAEAKKRGISAPEKLDKLNK